MSGGRGLEASFGEYFDGMDPDDLARALDDFAAQQREQAGWADKADRVTYLRRAAMLTAAARRADPAAHGVPDPRHHRTIPPPPPCAASHPIP